LLHRYIFVLSLTYQNQPNNLPKQPNKMTTKKITLATVKSFIKKNNGQLFINVKSEFDGMVDGCVSKFDGFVKAEQETKMIDATLGIKDAWFVRDSNDYFKPYETENLKGIEVMNSCSHFILAIVK
jgi:hypothetical protein